jgi:hypothetical protein
MAGEIDATAQADPVRLSTACWDAGLTDGGHRFSLRLTAGLRQLPPTSLSVSVVDVITMPDN